MKLQDIKTYVTVPPTGIGGSFWVIVKITTDNGIEGIGECYGIPVSGGRKSGRPRRSRSSPSYNAQVAPHIYCGPIAHAAAAHAAFSSPSFLILETILTDFHDAIVKKPLTWERGYMVAPREPGLGIELDEAAVLAHPYTTGGRLHLEMCQTPLISDNRKTITELPQ